MNCRTAATDSCGNCRTAATWPRDLHSLATAGDNCRSCSAMSSCWSCSVASSCLSYSTAPFCRQNTSAAGFAAQPQGYSDVIPVLEQIHSLPPLQPHLTYAPLCASNRALAHILSPIHTFLPDLRSQVGLNSRVDQLAQRVDNQNNLIGQLLRQINLNQSTDLKAHDEERRICEYTGEHFEGSQTSQSETNMQGRERDSADETQTSASRTLSQLTIHSILGSQEARVRERLRDECNNRRSR
ncbi:hypothetical protein L3X38_001143 [Prunus dulcis]|uniref:Uncharacterized protein n=1 Tax=Prunus dulcis TaxID=3755 RepID=A0AAD4WTW4_PRUDU|nr:hypothetical protein L3X38_001143 [Prunus dulcis]